MNLAYIGPVRLCIAVTAVEFEWDERKARTNLLRRRVDFAGAATVFEDVRAVTVTR